MEGNVVAVVNGRPGRDTALRQILRPLAPYLGRAEVTELAINRPGEVWTRTFDGWEAHAVPELTAGYVQGLATAMAAYSGLPLTSMVSVTLPGGERGQIVQPPACMTGMTPLTIRKHLPVVRTLSELEEEGAFEAVRDVSFHRPTREEAKREGQRCDSRRLEESEVELLELKREWRVAEFLRTAVRRRKNIVLAGKTGSGKTTLARSLIEEVAAAERIVTIEDVHELKLRNHPNVVHLVYGSSEGRVSAEACLAVCMRLSPDRIFLAELRGAEAWEYVQGLNTGHPGSITTTHANSAIHAFSRVEHLVRQHDGARGLDPAAIRRAVWTTLDVTVFMVERRVREVFYDPIYAKGLDG